MKRILLSLVLLGAVLAMAAGLALHEYRNTPLTTRSTPLRFKIERGANLAAIGDSMRGAGVQVPQWQLSLAFRLRGDARSIKAGVYEIADPLSLKVLLDKMVRGDTLLVDLLVVEGWTFKQLRARVARHPELRHDATGLDERQLLAAIGAPEKYPEGLFFPSTYRFSPDSSDLDIYREAYRLMQQTLQQAWRGRHDGLPLQTPYQALVLASIVEKETGREEDRTKVAAVFLNRLRIGMPLQSDPTTIYGLGERFDGNLRKRDLQADTAYNTYTRGGLPPTPIALPGKASIEAVMHPADIRALYFVARGDGSSEFSDNLSDHNRAVARYQLKRKP